MNFRNDDDEEDYLHALGWLQNEPLPPSPRKAHIGEHVYSEEWRELMLTHERYAVIAPNSKLAGILHQHPRRLIQRHATICATFVCWLGTACGMSMRLTAERRISEGDYPGRAWLCAWAGENMRRTGVNHGYRMIEHLLAKPSDLGRDYLGHGGLTLVRRPRLSLDDYEVIEILVQWLGDYGSGFLIRCERRIEELNRFDRATRLAEHRETLAKLGLGPRTSMEGK